jgi:hypothetical protein
VADRDPHVRLVGDLTRPLLGQDVEVHDDGVRRLFEGHFVSVTYTDATQTLELGTPEAWIEGEILCCDDGGSVKHIGIAEVLVDTAEEFTFVSSPSRNRFTLRPVADEPAHGRPARPPA